MSPDSLGYQVASNPQSLNLYAYVMNNPLIRVDLDGHDGNLVGPCQNSGDAASCMENLSGEEASWTPAHLAQQLLLTGGDIGMLSPFAGGWAQKQSGNYSTAEEAQNKGSLAAFGLMVQIGIHMEWGDATYENGDGTFSYTNPQPIGKPCAEDATKCEGEVSTAVPKGTTLEGTQHTHPWVSDDHQFDGDVRSMQGRGNTYYDYVAGPSSNAPSAWGKNPNVFRIDPNGIGSVCKVSGPSSISSCN